MVKKIIMLGILVLSICACSNSTTEEVYPVNRAKGESIEEQVDDFLNTPLLNEKGEKIAVNNFDMQRSKNYKILECGVIVNNNVVQFIFAFSGKGTDPKIEYVKVESVVPGDSLTFIDESIKGKNLDPNVLVDTAIGVAQDEFIWAGKVDNMPNIIVTPDYMSKNLFKFTIKPVGKPEEIIYQPTAARVLIFSKHGNKK